MSSPSSPPRGIAQTATKTVVPIQTQRVQVSTGTPSLDTALTRFQSNVCDALDSVLSYINGRFVPAAPAISNSGRTVKPDASSLALANGFSLASVTPMLLSFPSSLIVAGTTNGTLGYVPLDAAWALQRALVSCLLTAGTLTFNVGPLVLNPATTTFDQTVATPSAVGVKEEILVTYTASSSVAITPSVICLTLYVGVLTA